MRYSKEILILILLLILFCTTHAGEIEQIKYGAVAGSITGYYDSIGVIATVYMRHSDDPRPQIKKDQWVGSEMPKTKIIRFLGRQFIIDSLPVGEYTMMISGETYNSAYQFLGYGKCCCEAKIQISPDSITIIKVNILPKNREFSEREPKLGCLFRTDSIISNNHARIEYKIEKRGFKKELMTLCFRCGTYYGRLNNGRGEQYVPTDTVLWKPLRIMPAYFTDGGLSVDLISDKIYLKNGYKIHYKETRENNNIFISLNNYAPESDVNNPDIRRPATGSYQLKLDEGKYNLFFITHDTSAYSIDVKQKRIDIELIDSGSVNMSTNPLIWKETF